MAGGGRAGLAPRRRAKAVVSATATRAAGEPRPSLPGHGDRTGPASAPSPAWAGRPGTLRGGSGGTWAPDGRGRLSGGRVPCQWLPESSPVSLPWRSALRSFSPVISTVLPRWAYLVSIVSRAATEEASQTWASDRSMTILSGSPA